MGSINILKLQSIFKGRWLTSATSKRECWELNPGQRGPEASMLTMEVCCPPPHPAHLLFFRGFNPTVTWNAFFLWVTFGVLCFNIYFPSSSKLFVQTLLATWVCVHKWVSVCARVGRLKCVCMCGCAHVWVLKCVCVCVSEGESMF